MGTIYQFDLEHELPAAELDGDPFYWTNVWFCDVSIPGSLFAMIGAIDRLDEVLHSQDVHQTRLTYRTPPYAETGHVTLSQFDDPCDRTVTGPYSLINVVRLELLSQGRVVGYKRLRSPLMAADIEGTDLTDTVKSYFETNARFYGALAGVCSSTGQIVDDYRARKSIAMWQLRRGTIRRARHVLASP